MIFCREHGTVLILQLKRFMAKGSISVNRDASLLRGKEIFFAEKANDNRRVFSQGVWYLEGKGMLPDILDYGLATHNPIPMKIYEFSVRNNLDYGGSEGIYLDLWIEYYENQEKQTNDTGEKIFNRQEPDEAK